MKSKIYNLLILRYQTFRSLDIEEERKGKIQKVI